MMRLPPVAGEWIRRDQTLFFHFEGQRYQGLQGDTITSALLANGVTLLGRSFKYHRPRSVLSAANHDANVMMQLGAEPNVRADVTALEDGMVLTSVNVHGSLKNDLGRWLDWLAPLLPVGFYYKAFHTRRLFPTWERLFRFLTGLGRIDLAATRQRTPKRYDFCDVLVVGAGCAGISAALTAADAGAQVVIVDENARAGGSLAYAQAGPQHERLQVLLEKVSSHPSIKLRTGTLAAGYYTDHWIPLVDGACITKMRARAVIVATGAYEQPAVFRNNDLPGIMLASAAQRLICRHAVKPFSQVVVLAGNDDAYRAALDYLACGIQVVAMVELRDGPAQSDAALQVVARGIPIHFGHCIYEAVGSDRVAKAVITPLINNSADVSHAFSVACDGIAMSVGWAPAAALLYQAGANFRFNDTVGQFMPAMLPAAVFAAGRVNGVYGFERKFADGRRAGIDAAHLLGLQADNARINLPPEATSQSHPWPIVAHPRGKNFVDFDEDLQLKDFENAAQEGFDNIELLKRFTTAGMGPSQGKHSNMNVIRVLARLRAESMDAIGTTTSRPFVHPVSMAHLAGRGFQAERETPLHSRHAAAGAIFMPAGVWQRPEYYVVAGKTREQSIRDEVFAVRNNVGLIDVGTLGKIEISGPDAGAFLDRVYTGRFSNMNPGTTRYGVMLDEAAVIIDDGVIACLAAERFYFTTTTSGSATVYRELTRLNTMWRMNCGIVNVTGHMAAVNLAGPGARDVLQQLTPVSLADERIPYLAVREIEIAGIAARVLRIGFVGELGYEIHVPADCACTLWDALVQAGKPYGLQLFGVEAQRLLRLEKGHVIIGQDTDGLTTPDEAAVSWAVKMDKPFFIGQRSLAIIRKQPAKQRLVGFELEGQGAELVRECHLVIEQGDIKGRVTSVAWSPTLSKHIGLVLLTPDQTKAGTRFSIRVSNGSLVAARVTALPFYDAQGHRQKPAALAQAA